MNAILLVSLCMAASAFGLDFHPDDPHNHETLVNDEAEFKARADCALGVGPCSHVMADYLQQFPAALKEACRNCSPEMKMYVHSIFKKVEKDTPEAFKAWKLKFDPEQKYFDALEAAIANY